MANSSSIYPLSEVSMKEDFSTNVTESFEETSTESGLRRGFFTLADDITVTSVFILMSVAGFVLNFMTIFIVGLGKNIGKEFKIQLVNKAVVDMLTACLFPTFNLMYNMEFPVAWTQSLCQFTRYTAQTVFHAGPLCNAAISVERFIAVYFPLKASQCTRLYNYIIVVAIWLLTALPEIETLVHLKVIPYGGLLYCATDSKWRTENEELYQWIITMKYVIPTVVIVVFYSLIFGKIAIKKRNPLRSSSAHHWKATLKKVQIMLVVDAAVTLMTWLPYNLFWSLRHVGVGNFHRHYTKRQQFAIEVTTVGIMAINAFATPLIYFIFNQQFRKDSQLLLMRLMCKKITATPAPSITKPTFRTQARLSDASINSSDRKISFDVNQNSRSSSQEKFQQTS